MGSEIFVFHYLAVQDIEGRLTDDLVVSKSLRFKFFSVGHRLALTEWLLWAVSGLSAPKAGIWFNARGLLAQGRRKLACFFENTAVECGLTESGLA
jgi:hypothetical protein